MKNPNPSKHREDYEHILMFTVRHNMLFYKCMVRYMVAKMADDVHEEIDKALNTIASSMERSSNMKKELKQTIFETVSTLRKLFIKLKEVSGSKSKKITELHTLVATTKSELAGVGDNTTKALAAPSIAPRWQTNRSAGWPEAPSGTETAKHHSPPTDQAKLYSEVLGGQVKQTHYKLTVTPKESISTDAIKDILKSNINPTEMKIGINSLKSLKNGKVQIEASNKEDIDKLTRDIHEKCGDKLVASVQKLRNPRLVIYNIPDEISVQNIEDILIAQNPELQLTTGDINAKFAYVTKRHTRNLVLEVSAETRRRIIQRRVKLGWLMCNTGDYLVANRCYKCSKYNHKHKDCRGNLTCPLCAGNHTLKECTATLEHYKCINCHIFNTHNKNNRISDNHSSLDRNCPSLQAVLEKYKQNTDY